MRKFLFLLFTVMLVSGNVNAQYYDDEQYNGGYVEDTYDDGTDDSSILLLFNKRNNLTWLVNETEKCIIIPEKGGMRMEITTPVGTVFCIVTDMAKSEMVFAELNSSQRNVQEKHDILFNCILEELNYPSDNAIIVLNGETMTRSYKKYCQEIANMIMSSQRPDIYNGDNSNEENKWSDNAMDDNDNTAESPQNDNIRHGLVDSPNASEDIIDSTTPKKSKDHSLIEIAFDVLVLYIIYKILHGIWSFLGGGKKNKEARKAEQMAINEVKRRQEEEEREAKKRRRRQQEEEERQRRDYENRLWDDWHKEH